MSTSSLLFCEHCGAANEIGASYCCFCGRPLDEEEATSPKMPSSASNALPIDTLLKGRYRIIKPVGQGGMGTVYQAQDTELNNRAVAIKELIINDPHSPSASEAIAAFKREATLLAGLQHANLPSVFEHFEENERWYMAMTFIQGETLENHLERNPSKKLPVHEVLAIGKQLSSVLYYLHNQHPPIIFRDVKPANIMRTLDGQLYLIDFGVARRFKSGQKKDTIPFGSLGYAAPEQFGKSQTTPHSDIYALGATLYELLSGYEPASKPLKLPLLRTLEPTLPFKLVTLVTQMLDRDPNKRPANMLIVEQKLQEIDGSLWQTASFPPTFPGSSTTSSGGKKSSVRLMSVIGTIIALICLCIGAAIGGVIGNSVGLANGQVEANATYQANASATASTQANATATEVQTVALPDPYPPTTGKLALFDPLSQENQWQNYSDEDFGGSCTFKDSSFQVEQTKTGYFYHCDEAIDTLFQNFAIEVTMKIVTGDCGGFTLRESADNSGKLYLFSICNNYTYSIIRYSSNDGSSAKTLAQGKIARSEVDFTRATIAVVANSSTLDFYVNQHKITSTIDSTYTIGTIGLVANAVNSATSIWYQDIKIWALP